MNTAQRKPVHFKPDFPATERLKDHIFHMTLVEGYSKKVDFVGERVVLDDHGSQS